MVKVNGKPIMEYQLSVLKQAGIDKNLIDTGIEIEKKLWEELRHHISKRD